ncbi:MAG: PIN domain nuclease [Chloroflexi bacterium]|nr:PIN domain nuclease [Chloroflexota bacterium]
MFVRSAGAAILGIVGWRLGAFYSGWQAAPVEGGWIIPVFIVLGLALGFGVSPYLTTRPIRWGLNRLDEIPAGTVFAAVLGLAVGLALSALLAWPLSQLPGLWGKLLPVGVSILFGYLGMALLLAKGKEFPQFFGSELSRVSGGVARNGQFLLDTSAIIDGRIADVSQTGFISGTLVIPRFILDELQHIADSSDSLRRNRGRRGLEVLNKLRKETDVPIKVVDVNVEDVYEVDGKLVKLAKSLQCPIITTDYNLNRVAELQGIRILNINELANAIKPIVLPGEEMRIRVIQEGKEVGQGVGYLDDGTMVVVENGRRYLNSQIDIIITRVLQTAAGRIIFAHPKAA